MPDPNLDVEPDPNWEAGDPVRWYHITSVGGIDRVSQHTGVILEVKKLHAVVMRTDAVPPCACNVPLDHLEAHDAPLV